MARKELTLDAMKIADSIRNQSVRVKDCHVAEAIGVDAATICRFKAEHLDKFCAYLDYLGLTVVEKGLTNLIDRELDALKLLASKGIENVGK